METNGTNNVQDQDNGRQNGASTSDNLVSFPSNKDTQLRDISTLLQGAPVIQQTAPTRGSAISSSNGGATSSGTAAIATSEDFERVEEKPFARKVGPRAIVGAGLAMLAIFPLAAIFGGGGEGSNDNQAVELNEAGETEKSYVSVEEFAAQQAELEQLRSQQAFVNQQVDAEAIDAAGRQRQQANPSTRPASSPTASPSTASRPARTTAAVQPSSVTVRPAPAPSIATAPSRPAPVTTASRAPAPAALQPTVQASARTPEAVDPFEHRAQLQELGSYGAPPPMAKATQTASYEPSNPFETQYVQAIAIEPQPAIATPSKATQEEIAPAERPLSPEEVQYEQDAAAVLSTELPGDQDSVAAVEDEQLAEAISEQPETTALAILPGTSIKAELPHGFSWQEGAPLPEVIIRASEDIMAGEQVAIPAETQFLGQAEIDPTSGAVTIQIIGMFGETNVSIPRASVVVQAEDGSVLTASASGGAAQSSGPSMGGFFMAALRNGLGNVIDGDNNLAVDIAGGAAETIIAEQVERSEANANASASRSSAQPIVWNLDARTLRVTFNHYIPLADAQL
ncbi:MAG: hypothetical protein HC800_21765 [Phormidesmis sp. RL_2_1]|nr:hypothetical protein [Phormidesmis sp. RL_2_1]